MFKRQTSGSIVCPSCGRLVGVNDRECFNCGRRNPGMWGFAPVLQKLGLNIGFTQIVMTGCAILYGLTLVTDWKNVGNSGMSILAPGTPALFLFGASGAWPIFGFGRWWTPLSAAWLHGGLLHIGFNMLWLRQIMPAVEEYYGTGRLIIIYTVSSYTGFLLTSLMYFLPLGFLSGAYFTVGASAPLFGLFGALLLYSKRVGHTALGQEIWRWVIIFVVIGLIVPFVDNWAHLGGLAGGWLTARILDPLKPENANQMLVALLCLLLIAASIVASVLLGAPLFRAPVA
ncbi:MAG: rhomboid family intramembrane serine protease [Acidobacteriota bacterium]|jgi:rhomboid protease GluP